MTEARLRERLQACESRIRLALQAIDTYTGQPGVHGDRHRRRVAVGGGRLRSRGHPIAHDLPGLGVASQSIISVNIASLNLSGFVAA